MSTTTLVDKINAILPQTQCRQCGHPGCLPYAEALAAGRDPINRCPPGGYDGIQRLATLLNRAIIPFDADGPQPKPRALALIREDSCIGCTLCIQACPVDAIVGASKRMHTVIRSACTGCELCLLPCPVDCIDMVPVEDPADGEREQRLARAAQARSHYERRLARKAREQEDKAIRLAERSAVRSMVFSAQKPSFTNLEKQDLIRKAMERAARIHAAREQEDKENP